MSDQAKSQDDQIVFLTYGQGSSRPTAHRLLREEVVLVRSFISTGSLEAAAVEAGIPSDKAKAVLARPEVKQYAEERIQEQAAAAGITREAVLFAVSELLRDPTREASQAHLKAIDVASKVLKMVQPAASVTINQGASPFEGMTDAAFHAEFEKRMNYRKENKPDGQGTRLQ